MDKQNFKDPKNIDFKNLQSFIDAGKESLGCLPPDFDKNLALIPGLPFKDVDTMNYHFPSLDSQDVWKESPGFMLPDFEIELRKFTNSIETMKESSKDNFRHSLSQLDYMRNSLSGKESLGILKIENLDISFGESSLNPLNDEQDIIERLNTAHIFNKSAGLDVFGSQSGLITPRRLIKSDSAAAALSTRAIYTLSENQSSNGLMTDVNDSVFTEKLKSSPYANDDETIGDLSCIAKDHDMVYLDCTPQPDWPSDLENSSRESAKLHREDVFKEIDIKIPVTSQMQNQKATGSVTSHPEENRQTKVTQVVGNIVQPDTCELTPEKALQNISDILNKSNISAEEKSKGQMLILQLSEILSNTKLDTSRSPKEVPSIYPINDSGNCTKQYSQSFDKEKYEVYEVLDLSRKSCEAPKLETSPNKPLNLSAIPDSVKILNRSNSQPVINTNAGDQKGAAQETIVSKVSSKMTVKINVIKPSPPCVSLRKTQKQNGKPSITTQKGPLKAVIPVRDMKRGSSVTPERSGVASSMKKAKTPQDSKPKPLASSTPTFGNENNATSRLQSTVPSRPATSKRPLAPNSANKNIKQGSCLNKKDIKFPSSRISLGSYDPSSSKLKQNSSMPRRSLPVTPVTNKVQKVKKADKENIPK
ncbi:unnamed protein product [Acanthoscelides obtectus]|uniref:Uncharacterized protein n=1 Tax=Acanthoscelides obtectus TaxID=200917 RepID=A0A9P0M916_ACAOB|nr:unnamed protein product [Acanthoscelides obtectus]CAK1649189.1 hypothetical protein AOBTE_LOCUS16090 [Acanthoscelides obtectus]